MIVSALFLVTVLGAVVEMDLAPDQPVPHVYVDDPLIIEFRTGAEAGGRDVQANVDVTVESDCGLPPANVSLGQLGLRAHGTHWQPVESIPKERGRYRLKANMSVDGATTEMTGVFCRIDRPTARQMPTLSAYFEQPGTKGFLALKSIGILRARFSAGVENLTSLLAEAAAANLQVVLMVDANLEASCEALAKEYDAKVVGWDIDCAGSPDTFVALSKMLRQGQARAPIRPIVRSADELTALLNTGAVDEIGGAVWAAQWPSLSDARRMQSIAHSKGMEDLPVNVLVLGDNPPSSDWTDMPGLRLVHTAVEGLETGVPRVGIAAPLLYTEDFGPGYALVCAMTQRLSQSVPVGFLEFSAEEKAAVFRRSDTWAVVGWSSQGDRDLTISLGDAVELAVYDARNNPLPLPAPVDGNLMLALTPSPLYLVGKGGSVVGAAAHNAAKSCAVDLTGDDMLKGQIPPELATTLAKIAAAEPGQCGRADFINLLKAFPVVEEQWHNESIAAAAASTLLAGMNEIALDLCVAEQERGEAFVEPLQKTLANCGQSQSLYLTSSSGSSEKRGRPDWLFDNVTQLMEQAEHLSEEGRGIEACAVAALAEARARGLEVMTRPKQVAPPQVAPPAEAAPPPAPDAPQADAPQTASEQDNKSDEPKPQSTGKTSKKSSKKK